jgi:hypothetical protein
MLEKCRNSFSHSDDLREMEKVFINSKLVRLEQGKRGMDYNERMLLQKRAKGKRAKKMEKWKKTGKSIIARDVFCVFS